jgi:hypothetical protein
VLDDDLFASPTGPLSAPDQGSDGSPPGSFPWATVLIALVAAAALGLGVWFFLAFSPRLSAVGDVPVDELFAAPPLRRREPSGDPWGAFEDYLAELTHEPEPSQAVLLAFAYAEAGVGVVPPRIVDETPYEWHRRIREIDAEIAVLVTPLLERYVAIRFGGHVAEDPERHRAIADLRTLTYAACGVAEQRRAAT